ncbi:MAG TPA: HD domain-containing protein, partial [Acidobacteria bacterium]|nr:HD domain-containing protein [Acidobacteriota bacterium]
WSPGHTVLHLFFAAGNAAEAAIPGLVLRPCRRRQCVLQVVLWTSILNTAANWVVARLLPSLLHLPGWHDQGWPADLSWWLGDLVAVGALALPLLFWLRPELFLPEARKDRLRPVDPFSGFATTVILAALVSALMVGSDWLHLLPFNWPAILYLVPIGLATARSGLGGALWANAVCAVAYLGALGLEALWSATPPLIDPARMFVTQADLVVMAAFALGSGTRRTRDMLLLDELENRWEDLRQSFEGMVRGLAAAIEARDPGTHEHVDRVAQWAEQLARRLGCPEDQVETIRWGAILHDVGKIGVPDEILFKPGPLTPEEHRIMDRHLDLGAQIVERTGFLPEAVPLIRYHEERWDGSREGRYAAHFGLSGEEIPLGARIIAVVDAFDAMTSDRPYRKTLSREEAARQLRDGAGSQFDPHIVEEFLAMIGMTEPRLGRRAEPE